MSGPWHRRTLTATSSGGRPSGRQLHSLDVLLAAAALPSAVSGAVPFCKNTAPGQNRGDRIRQQDESLRKAPLTGMDQEEEKQQWVSKLHGAYLS